MGINRVLKEKKKFGRNGLGISSILFVMLIMERRISMVGGSSFK